MQADVTSIELADTHTILALSGSIDMLGAGAIEKDFLGYTADRKRDALIDMSAVDYLGSMGIRVFLSAAKVLGREQKKLVLFAAQPSIEQTLVISGFTGFIPVVPTLAEAKAKIGV